MVVYLCHKCAGLLTKSDDPALYHCHCISGYVRDWQMPETGDLRAIQLRNCQDTIKLFDQQGRKADDGGRLAILARIERLQAA